MSSTNRGGKRSPSDNYPTPPWVSKRLLEKLELPWGGEWLEPCAGEGAIVAAVGEFGYEHALPLPRWTTVEIRPEAQEVLSRHVPRDRQHYGDYFDANLLGAQQKLFSSEPYQPDVVISNPPFRIAYEVIQKSLWFGTADVVMLLRVNFLASVKRHRFMQLYPPDIYILPNRPDFKAHGKTDSIEYAWYHWPKGPRRRPFGKVMVLDETPLMERRVNFDSILHPLCQKGEHSIVLDPADGWVCGRPGCSHVEDSKVGFR